MKKNNEATNIRIHEDTKKELESLGRYGDTADSIVKKLIKFYKENCKNQSHR
jgi:predicted DNA-binding protein